MFQLIETRIDGENLKTRLRNPKAGAFASFEGWVRNHNEGHDVIRLEYEAFERLALKEGDVILAEARKRFDILDCRCVHRTGSLEIGDMAVWVGVNAAHRKAAFDACEYIIDEVKARLPIWKKEHYANGDSGWVNCQACAEHDHHSNVPDGVGELGYYARQVRLREIGEAGQRKLKSSRVLVVGAGGLGSSALQYLAAAGVGTLGICEFDRLEASNLHRQVLYDYKNVGEPKGTLAAERLRGLNPFIQLNLHPEKLDAENVKSILGQYDLILDCTDNFVAKFLLNDAAVLSGKPLVQASVYQYEGQLRLMLPGQNHPCLRCLWPEIPEPDCVGTCAEVGVLGAVPGVLGSLQALKAIKFILGLPTTLTDGILILDLLTHESRKIRHRQNPNCPLCGQTPVITEISPERYANMALGEIDLRELTAEELLEFEFLDIREPEELDYSTQPGLAWREIAIHQPASSFEPGNPPIIRDRKYLLVCQKGVRSGKLTQTLRQAGFENVFSLVGGVSEMFRHLAGVASEHGEADGKTSNN